MLSGGLDDPGGLFPNQPDDLRLEIGFGGGEHLAADAQAHPERGYFGCEPFVNGVAKLLVEVETRGLANIRVHPGDAGDLIDALPGQMPVRRLSSLSGSLAEAAAQGAAFCLRRPAGPSRPRHAAGRGIALRHRYRRLRGLDARPHTAIARFHLAGAQVPRTGFIPGPIGPARATKPRRCARGAVPPI